MQKKNKLFLDKKYYFLKPIKHKSLIRLGNKFDGGYVLDRKAVVNADCLVSYGIGDDWSFEKEFLKQNKNLYLYIYDHTVDMNYFYKIFIKRLRRFLTFRNSLKDIFATFKYYKNFIKLNNFVDNKKIKFFPLKITNKVNNYKEIEVDKTISKDYKNIIVKCDIEGDEYKIINKLKYFKNISMIIIEFHWPEKNFSNFKRKVNLLKTRFDLIHFHVNNYSSFSQGKLPDFIELSFLKKDKRNKKIYNKSFPIKKLDFPNFPKLNDFEVLFK